MRLDDGQIEVMDDAMAEVLRKLTPAQRLASTHALWRDARRRVESFIRAQHPQWDEQQISREIIRRMLGSE